MSFFRDDGRWFDERKACGRAQEALDFLADEIDGLLYARGFRRLSESSWVDEEDQCVIHFAVTPLRRFPFHTRFYNDGRPPQDG
jgi:hypothetical protein